MAARTDPTLTAQLQALGQVTVLQWPRVHWGSVRCWCVVLALGLLWTGRPAN